MKEYQVNYVELSTGEKIAYRKAGDHGRTILLIHGNMSSSVHFLGLIEKLEKDFVVYALDLVGFGDSSYNRRIDSLEDFSKDVTAFIRHFDLRDIIIIGWSMGGGVALETSVDNQDRISQILLLSSVGVKGLKIYKNELTSFGMFNVVRMAKREDVEEDIVQTKQYNIAIKNKDREYFRLLWDAIFINNRMSEEEYDMLIDASMKQRNIADAIYSLANFNMTTVSNGVSEGSGRIYQLRRKITYIHGDLDTVVPILDAKNSVKIIGERAEYLVFHGCGHSIMVDDLERLYSTIIDKIVPLDRLKVEG